MLMVFMVLSILGCSSQHQKEDWDFFQSCRYVGFLPESTCQPIVGGFGFSFTVDDVEPLADENTSRLAIAALPTSGSKNEAGDFFLFSFGIHVLLNSERVPKFIVFTSGAPRLEICDLREEKGRYFFDGQSSMVASGSAQKYYETLAEDLASWIDGPIARDQLNHFLHKEKIERD